MNLPTIHPNRVCITMLLCMTLFVLTSQTLFSQASIVRNRLQMLAMGKIDEVKKDLPDLLAEFPEDPGVQFLHASVLEDMSKSLPIYQRIVKDKPDCEWGDDAQWRIVHFYAMKRDTNKARIELQAFRKNYPQSELLLTAYDLIRATVGAGKILPIATPPKTTEVNGEINSISPGNTPKVKDSSQSIIKIKSGSKDSGTKREDLIVTPNTIIGAAPVVFTLQVGVFKTKAAAESELNDYKAKHMRCSIAERKMPDGSLRFVVTIGDYTTKPNAEKAIEIVKEQCNCTPLIIQKLNQ